MRHHTSFLAAADVSSAGMLVIDKQGWVFITQLGKILFPNCFLISAIEAIIARSGHYKPREIDMLKVVKKLLDIGANLKGVVIQYQVNSSSHINNTQSVADFLPAFFPPPTTTKSSRDWKLPLKIWRSWSHWQHCIKSIVGRSCVAFICKRNTTAAKAEKEK